ncbi:hypothetical protein CAPN008_07400 [Capnocytophaga canis]|uniref:hypothetical protein n=1 Tax=Capnocytophaga canis TaxID=1848903 RepID=UPI001AD45F79|nr:hypothetical protein [Capnocytophaga canis]GIM60690.1 hypothetical protein CAPN008_07400 [Capnocytophaga canis]
MNNKNLWIYGIIGFSILFLGGAILFKIFEMESLPSQFYGALIGVVITAIITVFLLQGQTANEEKRERNLKVFEKKQEVYHDFLEKLKDIIQDGEITLANSETNIDELKDLIFQLGYIQMHTSPENTDKIFERVSKLIQLMNDFSTDKDKQSKLPKFYSQLCEEVFGIISILKSDLYTSEATSINVKRIEELLRECDLFIENEGFNKYELQNYFWNELQKQLKNKGYEIIPKDFTQDVNEFYARARNRHRWFGFWFPVYSTKEGKTLNFCVELENSYYYGFIKSQPNEKNEVILDVVQQTSTNFKETANWFGYKLADRNNLDFWKLNSSEFERLKHPRKREELIAEIVNEMDMYITKFQQIAKQNNV